MKFYKLTPTTHGHGAGYDPKINPGTLNMFATAAVRSFHSMIPSHLEYVQLQTHEWS